VDEEAQLALADARLSFISRASTKTSRSVVNRSAPMPDVLKVLPRMSFKTSCWLTATVTVFVAVGARGRRSCWRRNRS
jgi:hypothetical protein